MVLEFGAVGDLDVGAGLLGRTGPGSSCCTTRSTASTRRTPSVVAALLTAVPTGIAGPKAAEPRRAAGRPTEMVGLTPFIPVESLRVGART